MKLTRFLTTTAAAALAVAAATTHAATITWGPATNINPAGGAASDLDVDTTGTLVRALNLGTPSVAGTTVNGVNFEALGVATGVPSVAIGNFTLSTVAAGGLRGANFASAAAPFSGLSAPYQSLLRQPAFTSAPNGTMTLTMAGLTVGQSYQFQWWSDLSGAGSGTTIASAGNSVSLNANPTIANGGLGQFAIGTFTADASGSQAITFTPNAGGQPILNGFQLRQAAPVVPEPGTALFGVALCAVAGLRRRC